MNTLLCSDKYQYTMGHTFVENGLSDKPAIFNMFFRKAPDNNGFAVVSGITEVLSLLEQMGKYSKHYYKKFLPEDHYDEYCQLLSDTVFTGQIFAMKEGEIAFPNQPIITVQAPLLQAQILETPLLAIMNHQMAIATKASRVVRSTTRPVAEFGSRRAHGIWAATYGAKAAYIAGCVNSSNVLSTIELGVPCSGTMAHSYVTAFGIGPQAEYKAFDAYIKSHPGEPLTLLIDTYDTVKCGIKNAIKAFKANGITNDYPSFGVRLDSGDLTYLSIKCREALDAAGYTHAKIYATNGLDEYLIPELEREGAKIDCYGVGDAIATSKHNPCFGGVYKLVDIAGTPVIKMSEDRIKITNPGRQITFRLIDKATRKAICDITCSMDDSTHVSIIKGYELVTVSEVDKTKWTKIKAGSYDFIALQTLCALGGEVLEPSSIEEARAYHQTAKDLFDFSHLRLVNPHIYKNNISDELYNLKMSMMYQIKDAIDSMED